MEENKMSVFETLYQVNVNDKTEKKDRLTYLSWVYAWGEVKKRYPDTTYKIYENADGWNYFTDGRTCWVKTSVTIQGIEHVEYLPVMDNRNRSLPLDKVTSYDVNKAIQRSLTKACARHGLGLYVYAGEDLPEAEQSSENGQKDNSPSERPRKQQKAENDDFDGLTTADLRETEIRNICASSEAYASLEGYITSIWGEWTYESLSDEDYQQVKNLALKRAKK